jgi:hypothetical protein
MNLTRLLSEVRSAMRRSMPPLTHAPHTELPAGHVPQVELTAETDYRIDRVTDFDGSYAATVGLGQAVLLGNAEQLRRAAAELENAALSIDWAQLLDADCLTPLDAFGGEPA